MKVLSLIHERSNGERGAVAAEYAVLLALISVALAAAVATLTPAIAAGFSAAVGAMN